MTRDELQADIRIMEALDSVLGAIEEVSGVELDPGEKPEVSIDFSDSAHRLICAAHAIPHGVALAGLRAMKEMLEQMLLKDSTNVLERALR